MGCMGRMGAVCPMDVAAGYRNAALLLLLHSSHTGRHRVRRQDGSCHSGAGSGREAMPPAPTCSIILDRCWCVSVLNGPRSGLGASTRASIPRAAICAAGGRGTAEYGWAQLRERAKSSNALEWPAPRYMYTQPMRTGPKLCCPCASPSRGSAPGRSIWATTMCPRMLQGAGGEQRLQQGSCLYSGRAPAR